MKTKRLFTVAMVMALCCASASVAQTSTSQKRGSVEPPEDDLDALLGEGCIAETNGQVRTLESTSQSYRCNGDDWEFQASFFTVADFASLPPCSTVRIENVGNIAITRDDAVHYDCFDVTGGSSPAWVAVASGLDTTVPLHLNMAATELDLLTVSGIVVPGRLMRLTCLEGSNDNVDVIRADCAAAILATILLLNTSSGSAEFRVQCGAIGCFAQTRYITGGGSWSTGTEQNGVDSPFIISSGADLSSPEFTVSTSGDALAETFSAQNVNGKITRYGPFPNAAALPGTCNPGDEAYNQETDVHCKCTAAAGDSWTC